MKFENLLEEAIETQFENLKDAEVGSNEYKATADVLTKLMDRAIEIDKNNIEYERNNERYENEYDQKVTQREEEKKRREFDEEMKRSELEETKKRREFDEEIRRAELDETRKSSKFEEELKKKQMEEDRLHRIITTGITVAGIVIPSVITIWGTIKSFEFEREGTITTIMGRGFINKLLPKK